MASPTQDIREAPQGPESEEPPLISPVGPISSSGTRQRPLGRRQRPVGRPFVDAETRPFYASIVPLLYGAVGEI